MIDGLHSQARSPRLPAAALALLPLFLASTPDPAHADPRATPAAPFQDSLPGNEALYRERAARWFERNGIAMEPAPSLEELYRSAFVRIDLGLFEVLVPDYALTDEAWIGPTQKVAQALLDAQVEWTGWLPETSPVDDPQTEPAFDPGAAARHAGTLSKWIGSWQEKSMRKVLTRRASAASEPVSPPLRQLLGASPRVTSASEQLASALRRGASLGGELRDNPRACRLVILPTREDFVEFQAVVGLLELRHRPFFWIENTVFWTEFDYDGTRALALSFATREALADYTRSIPMNRKNPNEMAENVVQLAIQSLLGFTFGNRMDPILAGGIANDLVITQFGEVDTRTDGDLRSRRTAARSVFVPGGNPNGGTLPPVDAQSHWRSKRGHGYFRDVLRESQRRAADGAKEAWEKRTGFQLLSDDGSGQTLVRAPFLGPAATELPPQGFRGDHAEFLRAYRACFLHWLREKGAGASGASRESYSRVLGQLATGTQSLPEILGEVYGAPLSAATAPELFANEAAEPLEGRFLSWLAKR